MRKIFITEFAKIFSVVIFIVSAFILKADVTFIGNNGDADLSHIRENSSCKRSYEDSSSNDNSKRGIKVMLFDLYYEIDLDSKEAKVVGFNNHLGINHVYIEPTFEYNGEIITVVAIDDEAFLYDNTIQSVKIPDTVTIIKRSAFEGCGNLTKIDFGKGLKVIEEYAFFGADLNDINFFRVPDLYRGESL